MTIIGGGQTGEHETIGIFSGGGHGTEFYPGGRTKIGQYMSNFVAHYPSIGVTFKNEPPSELLHMLREGKIDLAEIPFEPEHGGVRMIAAWNPKNNNPSCRIIIDFLKNRFDPL